MYRVACIYCIYVQGVLYTVYMYRMSCILYICTGLPVILYICTGLPVYTVYMYRVACIYCVYVQGCLYILYICTGLPVILYICTGLPVYRDVNVFIFQKNDRFVMITTTKNRKRNDRFLKKLKTIV